MTAQEKLNARLKKRTKGRSIVINEKFTTDYINLGPRPKKSPFKKVFTAHWNKRRGQLKLGAV